MENVENSPYNARFFRENQGKNPGFPSKQAPALSEMPKERGRYRYPIISGNICQPWTGLQGEKRTRSPPLHHTRTHARSRPERVCPASPS